MKVNSSFFKLLIISCFILIISCVFIIFGYTQGKQYEKTISDLKTKNNILDLRTQTLNSKIQDLNNQIENYEQFLDIKSSTDNTFLRLLYAMRNDDTDIIKSIITSNIVLEDKKLVCKKYDHTFSFPADNVMFTQRYCNFEDEDKNTFESIYEVLYPEEEHLYECYVDYVLEQNEWKIDNIYIDGK